MQKKIVLALGGNALGNTPQEQIQAVKKTAVSIVDLAQAGHRLLLVHGNGPQVGMIQLAMENSHDLAKNTPEMPFPECGAMSQGYIGYHLQQAILNELRSRSLATPVVTLVTQVRVDEDDPAFQRPTKPIGSFHSKEEADRLAAESGQVFVEDSGRGYRRVVPSPYPQEILESKAIDQLLEAGSIVIAGGGGGVPVIDKDGAYQGVDAVIDKDFTSAAMAQAIDADELLVLTAVDQVYLNFGQENEEALGQISLDQAQAYVDAGEFGEGSMKPKIQAMIGFVRGKKGRAGLVTSLERAKEGLEGKTGTRIV